jgi:hypothetical protein
MPLYLKPASQMFEVHKLPGGGMAFVGYVTPEQGPAIVSPTGEISVALYPSARDSATALVAVPLARVEHLESHSTRTTGALHLYLKPA